MSPRPHPNRRHFRLTDKFYNTEFDYIRYADGRTAMIPDVEPDRYPGPPPLPGIYPSMLDAEQARYEVLRQWMLDPDPAPAAPAPEPTATENTPTDPSSMWPWVAMFFGRWAW